MKATILLVALAGLLAGCQARQDDWQSMLLPTTDYQAAFMAAREVLAKDYTIAHASFAQGVIETQPQLFQKTGAERQPGAYASGGAAQAYRRTVLCRLERTQESVTVKITVNVERQGASQAETLVVTQGGESHAAGAERRWQALDEHRATYWADIGRDRELETALLERIRARFAELAGETGAQPSSKSGESAGQLRQEAEAFK